uniref:Integrase, catalytic region, zinc finger, CCHC-type, peptidase aspartic, catalytic n=1 Tax=Tanacetum cinerariifolium TaxID=118510 RepID=A0A6L2P5L7_TANCI|nr:hypothetical protein [Tanacetum cinerariifolium]
MLLMQAQENGVALDEEQLLFIVADDYDAFESNIDEATIAQTMFMVNLSFADLVYDEANPLSNSDILSELHDHDHYQDAICEHHEVHEMHDDVQPNYVVDSHADYTSDSNMILYDQYPAQHVSLTTQNNVVDNSLSAELATYKKQVELYKRRANFKLTEREQKIDEQLRIVITDHKIKEENLKKELHSVKMKLTPTINHNKLMIEEVTSLKKDFKQKENKYHEEFLDMKALKEKVQSVLYNGHEIIKTNHVSAIVHNSEETLKIGEITRKKMKDPEYVKKKVKIAPNDYSKENYLATFTPQKQLTLEKIFWSKDLLKMKEEALKEQTKALRPIKALTMYPLNTPAMLDPRRITLSGLNEGEKGFEQTKEYLTEVIPFFKTLKEYFEGIQKALTKEIKEMKEIFEELEVEVDQNVVHRKHDEIEQKTLLIANDNLLLILFFVIGQLQDQIQSRGNMIHELREKISRLTKKHSDAVLIHDLKALDSQNKGLHAKVNALHDLNERWRAENEKFKRYYKELYDSIKITRAKTIENTNTNSLLTEVANLKAQIQENHKSNCVTMPTVKSKVLAPGMYVIHFEPIPLCNSNNREVHLDYLKHLKENVATLCEIIEEARIEIPLDSSLAYACVYTKHS